MLIIIIRTIILYFLIVFSLRLMGKKQLGELQPSELVTTIMISNIATLALEDSATPMIMGAVPILMIVSLDVIMSGVLLKSTKIRKAVSGTARVIISDGVIDQKEMKNLRYTIDDLTEAMREQGIFDLSQVQYAIVETTGKLYAKGTARARSSRGNYTRRRNKQGRVVQNELRRRLGQGDSKRKQHGAETGVFHVGGQKRRLFSGKQGF